jgi:hypothetical protein
MPNPANNTEPSYNPFTQMTSQPTIGLSMTSPPPVNTQGYASNNPFGQLHSATGLEQPFQTMQLAQPLFPHSTGGYPSQPPPLQDPRFQYSMTPPIGGNQNQQGYVSSPGLMTTNTNPFFQPPPPSAHSTGSNPFLNQGNLASPPSSASMNPWGNFQQPTPSQNTQQNSGSGSFNPFGIPPSSQTPQTQLVQAQDGFRSAYQQDPYQNQSQSTNPFQNLPAHQQQQQQFSANSQPQQPPFPTFQYGQPQMQPQQPQPSGQHQFQQQFNQPQQQPIMPQQTGRHDKNSIMALYNYPSFAPQSLSSIPEPATQNAGPQQQHNQQQQSETTPTDDSFGSPNATAVGKRSATMPVSLSNMHSAGGGGSRNPFLTNTTSSNANAGYSATMQSSPFTSPAPAETIAVRHASRDSMNISNLESGRHSPDAFASLSARYMR